MTASIASGHPTLLPPRRSHGSSRTSDGVDVPPLTARLALVRAVLTLILVVSVCMVLEVAVVSRLQHSAAQTKAFAQFREQVATGIAPVGPADSNGTVLAVGAPVAHVAIASIGVREVVGEGTTSSVLFSGPGHRRDTVLPGQIGTSVVFGRRWAFGAPFSQIGELKVGEPIKVTTAQGEFTYSVIAVRVAGSPLPPAVPAGGSRLTLVSATGAPFMPSGTVFVDADLSEGTAQVGAARLVTSSGLAAQERELAGDSSTLWALALWLQVLIATVVAFIWAWHRWGRAQAWIVFVPLLLLVGLAASGEFIRLLPNLL